MKKVFCFIFALACMLACNKASEEAIPVQKKTTISVGIDLPQTKTELTRNVDILWSEGDKVAVDTDSGIKVFTLESGRGSAFGTFSINEAVTVKSSATSFYPASMSPSYNSEDTKWHVNLPATYEWAENQVQAPMYAWLNGGYNSFRLLTSVIKVDIYNIPEDASKLVFTTFGEVVSGDYVFGGDCLEVVAGESNKSITINFTAGDAADRTFFIPVPYGSYSAGATFVLKNSANESLATKTTPAAIKVGKQAVSYFPAINFSAQKTKMIVWEGSKNVGESEWENFALPMDLELWKSLPVGTDVTVYLSRTDAGKYAQMQPACQYTSEWKWSDLADGAEVTGETTQRTFTLTDDNVAKLTNDCQSFIIRGENFTLTKVEVTLPKPERIIWTGSSNLGDWALDVGTDIPKSYWSNLPLGSSAVTIYFTEDGSVSDEAWSQVHFQAKTSPDWTDLGHNTYQKASGHRSYCCISLSSDNIASIQDNGVSIRGLGLIITKITLR
ncbi:MAG: hypothetical protein K6E61_07790 [Bacteroidales bacterium]|nr:hypothetical protein [Bacteroidales bacterium]